MHAQCRFATDTACALKVLHTAANGDCAERLRSDETVNISGLTLQELQAGPDHSALLPLFQD